MHHPVDRTDRIGRRDLLVGLTAAALWPNPGWGQEAPREGGIGGTGIVGTLSGAGGLSINGRLLLVSGRTRIEDHQGRVSPSDLRAGDSVTVEADGLADGRLRARRVALSAPLIGPAERSGGQLRVCGVVVTGPSQVLAQARGRVAVQGLWRGDQVVASRISAATDSLDVMAGAPRGQRRQVSLGGVPLVFGRRGLEPPVGRYAVLRGRFDGRALQVARVARERFKQPSKLRHLSVEGYLEPIPAAPGYAVSGLGHSIDRAARLAAIAGPRALMEGRYVGDFRAARGLILPEAPVARRALWLRRLQGDAPSLSLRG